MKIDAAGDPANGVLKDQKLRFDGTVQIALGTCGGGHLYSSRGGFSAWKKAMENFRSNPAHSDSGHYRDTARKLRELAGRFRFYERRKELLDLALRYERRADDLDRRSGASSAQS